MWECYNCAFQNVDTSPVCTRCRARKPAPGEKVRKQSYTNQTTASMERLADSVRESSIPPAPTLDELKDKWNDLGVDHTAIKEQTAILEARQYAIREAMKLLITIVKNPQAKGKEEKLANIVQILVDWDGE